MTINISDHSIILATNHQISGELPDGEVAILETGQGIYFGLNVVGGRIWELIQEPRSVAAIRDLLLVEYDVDFDTCSRELLALLKQMADQHLIEVQNPR